MKIMRIIARLNVGGPARHVVWLANALPAEEFQSVLIAGTVPEGEEDMSWFAVENGVEPIYIPEISREISPKDIVSLWKVYREIKREKPDIIHTHTAKAGTVGRVAGFFYRWLTWKSLVGKPRPVRFIHTYHGHIFHSYYGRVKTGIFLLIEKVLARLATDKIIVIARQQFEEIHHELGVGRAEQFDITPLGIDLEPFRYSPENRKILREEIGAKDDDILVGFIGRLTEIKNVSLLLKVAALYHERRDESFPNLKFVILGDGNLRHDLEREAEALGVHDVVKFLGNRNDVNLYFAGLDVVALTSLNEGTPLSIIEAMESEKPVISTGVGGVVDLLGDVETEKENFKICERGVRIESNDAEGFYNGLIFLAKDPGLRAGLSAKGKAFIEENYSKERLVEHIERIYRELKIS